MKGLFARRDLWSPEPSSTPVLVAVAVEVVAFMYLIEWFFMVTITGDTSNHLVVNAYLMGGLVLGFVAWLLARQYGSVTASTGGGFVVAAFALFARIQGETALYFVDVAWREAVFDATGLRLLMWARYGGFAAFVFGLAMVLAACLSERRLRSLAASPRAQCPRGSAKHGAGGAQGGMNQPRASVSG